MIPTAAAHPCLRTLIVAVGAALLLVGCATGDSPTIGSPATGAAPPGPSAPSTTASLPGDNRTASGDDRTASGDDRTASGDGSGGAVARTAPTLKVALLLPSGGFDKTAIIAKGMKQAAELALFESQRADVQLIVKDDKGTPEGARAAAEEAIREGAEVILGPLTARAVPGAAAGAASARVPVVAFSNDRTVAAPGVYLIGFGPEQDAERVVDYAVRQGKRRFAALVPDDAYGQVIGAAFKSAVTAAGGTIVAHETYPAGANAMIGPSRRIVEAAKAAEAGGAPIDAVFLPGGQDVLHQLGPLLTYSGFDSGKVKLLGSGAWEFASIGANEAFVGGWYAGPDPKVWREFATRFTKAYGQAPPRVASVAYDAMTIAMAEANTPRGQRFTAASLGRPTGHSGVDGVVQLVPGGVARRSLAILEVHKIGSVIVEPAGAVLDGGGGSGSGSAAGALGSGVADISGTPARIN